MSASRVSVRLVKASGVGLAAALALSCLSAPTAQAIPAFSRALSTECTTCHTIYPARNEFGEAFRRNGYVWPGGKERKKTTPQTEEERKRSEYAGLSGLPAEIPVGFSASWTGTYNQDAEDDFDPKRYSIQMQGGGNIKDKVGFYFVVPLASEAGSSVSVEESFFDVREPFGVPIDVRVGKMIPDLSVWLPGNRLSGRPATWSATVDGFSLSSAQVGAEVNAILGGRVLAVAGVLDKNIAPSGAPSHASEEFYGHLEGKIGGADYHAKEPDVDLEKDSVWDFLSLTAGVFGYSGASFDPDAGAEYDITRLGIDAGAEYKGFTLRLSYVNGTNDEAVGSRDSDVYSAAAEYVFNPRYAVALRYDVTDVEDDEKRTTVVPTLIWAPWQNLKVSLAYTHDDYVTTVKTASLRAQIVF